MTKTLNKPERASQLHKESKIFKAEAKRLGGNIRQFRQQQDLTLEQAAEKMDVDLKHLQKIEAGIINVTLVTLVRLAYGLKVSVAELFT